MTLLKRYVEVVMTAQMQEKNKGIREEKEKKILTRLTWLLQV